MKGLSKNVKNHEFSRTHYSVRQKIEDAGSISTQNIFPLHSVTPKRLESPYGANYFVFAENPVFHIFSYWSPIGPLSGASSSGHFEHWAAPGLGRAVCSLVGVFVSGSSFRDHCLQGWESEWGEVPAFAHELIAGNYCCWVSFQEIRTPRGATGDKSRIFGNPDSIFLMSWNYFRKKHVGEISKNK